MRTITLFGLLGMSTGSFAHANIGGTTYLGLFLQGNKIGYSSFFTEPTKLNGASVTRNDDRTVMDTGLLGTAMRVEIVSSSWTTKSGAPIRITFAMSSGGRSQKVDARFGPASVVAAIDNSGQKSTRTLLYPKGGQIVDDPLNLVLAGTMKPGAEQTLYVLDPTTVSFVRNNVKFIGRSKTDVRGKSVVANLIEIREPHSTTEVYVTGSGDLVRANGEMGIEMYPISKKEALGKAALYTPGADLAYITNLKTDKPIEDPAHLKELRLRITGRDLAQIPNGEYQTVTKDGDAWIVDVHPPQTGADPGEKIFQARADNPDWAKPSLDMPSASGRFEALAKRIVGSQTDVHGAAFAIRKYVYETMQPNAGIGVLRDANEILDSKVGVCRDYAMLTVTLLRAAGIPARLASGIVNWDGTFYYHAWAEAWDGHHWVGIDSTSDDNQVSAAHVKLGEGNVDEAFSFTFLGKAKIEVLAAQRE